VIALHGTREEFYLPVQNALVRSFQKLGYDVYIWYHRSQLPKRCDFLIWWGCNIDRPLLLRGRQTKGQIIYLERGWTMDRNTCCQLDTRGTGGLASWAGEGLQWSPTQPLDVKPDGDLLVVLRYERSDGRPVDNVRELSPYFLDNLTWLEHIQAGCKMPVRLRPHPITKAHRNSPLQHFAKMCGWEWDVEGDFVEATKRSKAVAVLDSTAGVWAMELGLPVLCFGIQVYRHPGVVYCLGNDVTKTKAAVDELMLGKTSLNKAAVEAMLAKIRAKQWYAKDEATFPDRLRKEFGI
jgi:hypothetical protein